MKKTKAEYKSYYSYKTSAGAQYAEKLLAAIAKGPITAEEAAAVLGKSAWTAWVVLKKLETRGKVVKQGKYYSLAAAKQATAQPLSKYSFSLEIKKTVQDEPAPPKPTVKSKYAKSVDIPSDVWKLDRHLNLCQKCADLYIVLDMEIDYPDDVSKLRQEIVEGLAEQFAAYLDMAVGGEFRHAAHVCSSTSVAALAAKGPLHAELLKEATSGYNAGRHAMWGRWKEVREKHGLAALEVVRDVFNEGKWDSSFGGKKWGTAAEILLRYLSGEDSKLLFVDTAFSLQHNTGCIFNKIYDTNGLQSLLNAKAEGYVDELVAYASKEVSAAWAQKLAVKEALIKQEAEEKKAQMQAAVNILAGIIINA